AGIGIEDRLGALAAVVAHRNAGLQVITETNTEYNVAPAQEAMTSMLFANPEIDGVLSLGGALSAGSVLAFERQGRDQ
ncbi:ABC transporter substrate-binding protein, partial [Rhizobium ruizarguesonis]